MNGFGDHTIGTSGLGWYAGLVGVAIGYSGYRAVADRQQTDRRFREIVSRRLMDLRAFSPDAREAFDRLLDKIRDEHLGVAALLGSAPLSEADNEAISAYDRKILDALAQLEQGTGPRRWADELQRFEQLIDERQSMINRLRSV